MDDMERLHADLAALRDELTRQGVSSARIEERLKAVEDDIHTMATGAEARFVLRSQWEPYRQIVASMVLLLLGGLVTFGFSLLGGGR